MTKMYRVMDPYLIKRTRVATTRMQIIWFVPPAPQGPRTLERREEIADPGEGLVVQWPIALLRRYPDGNARSSPCCQIGLGARLVRFADIDIR